LIKMKSVLNKKGQLRIGDAPGVVMIVLFLFMVIGTSAYVLEKYQEGFGANTKDSAANESITSFNETGYTVANAGQCNFASFAVSLIVNDSATTAIVPTTNYTYNTETGVITYTGGAATGVWYNDSNLNVSYTYNYGGADCEAVENIVEDFTDFIPWIGIILLVVAAAIVLGIVIRSFSGTRV